MNAQGFQNGGRLSWQVALLTALVMTALPAIAQQRGLNIYEEQLRVRLDQQLPEAREMGFDAGGWLNVVYFDFDDQAAAKKRTLRKYQFRAWARMNLQGVHRAYFRGLLEYDDWNRGDNSDFGQGDEDDQELERAWYQFDLGKFLKIRDGKAPPWGLRVKAGRQFATIGTSLVLSTPLDMVQFEAEAFNVEIKGILGQTIEGRDNIDRSPAVVDRQDRCFYGLQVSYDGLSQHRPFAYVLQNEDHTTPAPQTQNFEYTSRYIGAGAEGTLILPDLSYQAEVVGEWGRTYSAGMVTRNRDRIEAMAINVSLEYLFRTATRPRVGFEYIFGSGDSDRALTSTSTVGGNTAGTKDNAFNAFGFRDTGIAFAPEIANLHIYKGEASFFPLRQLSWFRKMEVGTKIFFYQKDKASGAIDDPLGAGTSPWVGWEADGFLDWRITSDLIWSIRYGAFMPGSAFDGGDKTCRQFIYTGLTFSF